MATKFHLIKDQIMASMETVQKIIEPPTLLVLTFKDISKITNYSS